MDLLYDTFYCIMITEVNTFYVISNLKLFKKVMDKINMVK